MMVELITTPEEEAASSYLDWDDEALGKLVKAIALTIDDINGKMQRLMKRPTDRIHTLEQVSGLRVFWGKENNVDCFQFMDGSRTVKTVFTYRKAKIFAEGVRIGKVLMLRTLP